MITKTPPDWTEPTWTKGVWGGRAGVCHLLGSGRLGAALDHRSLEFDFGLLKLETPMTLNSCVGTVKLPTGDVADGTSFWIAGWGTLRSGGSQPTTPQEAQENVIGNSRCTGDFGHSSFEITDSMLCAQGRSASGGISDACQGDSWPPRTVNRSHRSLDTLAGSRSSPG